VCVFVCVCARVGWQCRAIINTGLGL
jgi:hypothetical protein